MEINNAMKITGLMIYYYFVCRRKLWYYANDISMEQNSELVAMGKVIDENTYSREEKHFNINDEINIDFIKKNGVIHEVKKSRAIEEAAIWQVKYYIYYLQQRGINGISGRIDYPLLRQAVSVDLTPADAEKLTAVIAEIPQIVSGTIPEIKNKSICRKCSYGGLCLI